MSRYFTHTRVSWFAICAGVVAAITNIVWPGWGFLWNLLDVPPEQRPLVNVAFASVLTLAGLGFAILIQVDQCLARVAKTQHDHTEWAKTFQQSLDSKLTARLRELPAYLAKHVPHLDSFTVMPTAEANRTIIKLINANGGRVKKVLNTCAFVDALEERHPAKADFQLVEESVRLAVQSDARWIDVVSPGFRPIAIDRSRDLDGASGRYTAYCLAPGVPLMNFIVLEFSDTSREVWFGWPIDPATGDEVATARTRDERIVAIFESWHRVLCRYSERIVPPAAGPRILPPAA